jgi:hypothetical protein
MSSDARTSKVPLVFIDLDILASARNIHQGSKQRVTIVRFLLAKIDIRAFALYSLGSKRIDD